MQALVVEGVSDVMQAGARGKVPCYFERIDKIETDALQPVLMMQLLIITFKREVPGFRS